MYMTAESTSRNRSAILRGNPLGRLLCIEFSLGAGVVCVVVAIKTADILQMGLAARRYENHSMRKLRLFGSVDRRTTRLWHLGRGPHTGELLRVANTGQNFFAAREG